MFWWDFQGKKDQNFEIENEWRHSNRQEETPGDRKPKNRGVSDYMKMNEKDSLFPALFKKLFFKNNLVNKEIGQFSPKLQNNIEF